VVECPEYRSRIFLSVDLVGSTAFKGGIGDTKVDYSAHPLWVEEIRKFYQEFPATVRKRYSQLTNGADLDHLCDHQPLVWKTIGDEIIFCCRIRSADHLVCVVHSFMQSLSDYGRVLDARDKYLDVKGAAWLAAFPAPNVTVEVFQGPEDFTEDLAQSDLPSEELEILADNDPHKFDFLGKGIDCGFRLAKYSSSDKLTLSVELALALCDAANSEGTRFIGQFNYLGREELKGVIGGRPYPIVTIDTERNPNRKKVIDLERSVNGHPMVAAVTLGNFLKSLMLDEEIEPAQFPEIRTALQENERPRSYLAFRTAWESIANESNKREQSEISAANADDLAGNVPEEVEAALDNLAAPAKDQTNPKES
jgi:hypothetical protein